MVFKIIETYVPANFTGRSCSEKIMTRHDEDDDDDDDV